MFEFRVVTIFPEMFDGFKDASLLGKARQRGDLSINLIDLREFALDRHRSVDDSPYGGGSGMIMKPEPIFGMLDSVGPCHKVLLTPQGRPFDHNTALALATRSPVLLFCGRYEGVDERILCEFDEEISLGDFVLSGGEVAAMAVIEAVSRLLPGVLGNSNSAADESFCSGLLEYPQYTRPEEIRGKKVPEVLLSGNHEIVARWRRSMSLLRTKERRPDLFEKMNLSNEDRLLLEQAEKAAITVPRQRKR